MFKLRTYYNVPIKPMYLFILFRELNRANLPRLHIRTDLNQRQTNIQRSDKSALRYCLHLGTTSIYENLIFHCAPNGTRGPLLSEIFNIYKTLSTLRRETR